MNLEELRSVQRAERQKDSLQHLRDSFYEDVAAYIAQLKDERERAVAAADDPFASEDVRRLTDELESTKEIANALYERRVGKVVKHASFAAADMNTDEEGMTTEERALFEDLVGRIRQSRESVSATLEGRGGAASGAETPAAADAPVEPDPEPATTDDPPQATDDGLLADALGGESEPDTTPSDAPQPEQSVEAGDRPASETETASESKTASETETGTTPEDDDRPHDEAAAVLGDDPEHTDSASASSTPAATDAADAAHERAVEDGGETESHGPTETDTDVGANPGTDAEPDRATVRITADIGTVYGVDEREYDLAREDVVMLPTTNAEPLVQKNAAERID